MSRSQARLLNFGFPMANLRLTQIRTSLPPINPQPSQIMKYASNAGVLQRKNDVGLLPGGFPSYFTAYIPVLNSHANLCDHQEHLSCHLDPDCRPSSERQVYA